MDSRANESTWHKRYAAMLAVNVIVVFGLWLLGRALA